MIAQDSHQALFQQYDVSPKNGFLPDDIPLQRLEHPYYLPWESVVENLPSLVATRKIRERVDSMPLLETGYLETEQEWRRAYVVLGFLTHAYIWGGERPAEYLPVQVARPFLIVADHGGLPTTANYAALVLWNFTTKSKSCSWTEPENLQSSVTITGTRSEEWFYLISVAVEANGGPLIVSMLNCIDAMQKHDDEATTSYLNTISDGIKAIDRTLKRMHEHCDPQIFYHNIRPFLAGSKGMAAAGLRKGVFYNEGDGKGSWRQYSGGSNAQSALIQLFDIFLQVEHYATGQQRPGSMMKSSTPDVRGFIKEMRRYMPERHGDFLAHMASTAKVRDFVKSPHASLSARKAYDEAVSALVEFRNTHIQIVARYIVQPSRSPPAEYITQKTGKNLATASSLYKSHTPTDEAEPQGLQGTGGTLLMPFLKVTRDETRQAAVH